mgnify:CR=1 FL=1
MLCDILLYNNIWNISVVIDMKINITMRQMDQQKIPEYLANYIK